MSSAHHLFRKTTSSPVGELTLVASDHGLVAILWPDDSPRRVPLGETTHEPGHPILKDTTRQLDEYFTRQRTAFDLPLDLRGTSFQQSVWRALTTIPYGETRSYLALATQLGNSAATRAVGAANGRNPISIVVPCHRVIGSSGRLTGFAGGLEAKARLLELEQPARQRALTF
ncbi:MAG: methylated-DNA--[protein]-cysteine S-methyltransferase [Edaphobacter sp.]|uniref:methylated-DNA--[protein]-cysteine S-methyltransferase n=1 Tax=Edaphobacter sp. TaxID=1934404 RepID=UPI002394EB26|nr:methylated-DNA--[protein]-cysteine S-methyltransferase [Edaphobacter sp.]MDE1178797.1 methylated-DNA--[protein]-cysteine S-methyltransferase [Edaphobacter sp.]